MTERKHALLSASSAKRWLECPPSARLCESYPDNTSVYAEEGTAAHQLCEFYLKKALGIKCEDPHENNPFCFDSETEDCANSYVQFILEILEKAKQTCKDPKVFIEQKVDYSRWVEEGFGTCDCAVIADGTLHICDYKHGSGVLVEADDNPQMKLYAHGCLEIFNPAYPLDCRG